MTGQPYLQKLKQKHNLIDTWRKIKHTKRTFTYHNYNNPIHSRIDRIYATQNLKLNNINLIPKNLSDHNMISLTIQIKKQKPKGNGFWKLNTSILKKKRFQRNLPKLLTKLAKRKNKIQIN